jgi:hypothetical protein
MTFDSDEDCTAGAVLLVLLALSYGHCNGPSQAQMFLISAALMGARSARECQGQQIQQRYDSVNSVFQR